MVERARRFVGRHLDGALLSILLLIVAGVVVPRLSFQAARAGDGDEKVALLKEVILSDVSLSERLMALEALKKEGGSDANDALEGIARKGPLPVAAAACAHLGMVKSASSKGNLKALLEDAKLDVKVRMAAAACIAEHWKDEGDVSYLEDKCADQDDLKSFCAAVGKRVFNK